MDEEIDTIIQAVEPEPLEETDTIEVLATWKQTREAMAKEKLDRGFKGSSKGRPPSSPSRQNWIVLRRALGVSSAERSAASAGTA